MEPTDFTIEAQDVPAMYAGAKRAAERLARKRLTNKSLPTREAEPTRQVKRAQFRADRKEAYRHHNEEVRGCNQRKTDFHLPGNRKQRRTFKSPRCPKIFRRQMIEMVNAMQAVLATQA